LVEAVVIYSDFGQTFQADESLGYLFIERNSLLARGRVADHVNKHVDVAL